MSGQVLLMPDHFCVVSDHAKLKLVLTDIMSVQQQIVIICRDLRMYQFINVYMYICIYTYMYARMYMHMCVIVPPDARAHS